MSGFLRLPGGERVPVRDGLVLGRVAGCDVVLDDVKASRKHARVVVESGVVEIEDLGSSNGTLLNGKPVTRRLLRHGDEVRIGRTAIVYEESGGAAGTESAAGSASAGEVAPRATAVAPAAAREPASVQPGAAGDDDVDLFADPSPAPAKASPQPPRPQPLPASPPAPQRPAAAPPSPSPSPSPFASPAAAAQPSSPPPPAPPKAAPRADVVEFADEVVEVRRPAKAETPAAGRQAGAAGNAAHGEPAIRVEQRVLQFSKKADARSPLADDLAQMSGGRRLLAYAVVLALAAAAAWGIVVLVR